MNIDLIFLYSKINLMPELPSIVEDEIFMCYSFRYFDAGKSFLLLSIKKNAIFVKYVQNICAVPPDITMQRKVFAFCKLK